MHSIAVVDFFAEPIHVSAFFRNMESQLDIEVCVVQLHWGVACLPWQASTTANAGSYAPVGFCSDI